MDDPGGAHLQLELPGEVRQIRIIRLLTATALRSLTAQDETRIQRLLIAISEIFNNAVKTTQRSGSAESIRFRLDIDDNQIVAAITDAGGGFGDHQQTDVAGLGKGLAIAEAFSDSIEVASADGVTMVTMMIERS